MSGSSRVAFVTGGVAGIGAAICRCLVKDGCRVVASYYPAEQEAVEAWKMELAAQDVDAAIVLCGVSSAEECARSISEIERQLGRVSILVNCAGIIRGKTPMTPQPKPACTASPWRWLRRGRQGRYRKYRIIRLC